MSVTSRRRSHSVSCAPWVHERGVLEAPSAVVGAPRQDGIWQSGPIEREVVHERTPFCGPPWAGIE